MDFNLKDYIAEVENFPIDGINFKDITSLCLEPVVWKYVIDQMADKLKDLEFDAIVGPESRSFMFLGALSYKLNKPFVLFRKKSKLPRKVVESKYDLEYGSDSLFVHEEDIKKYNRVVIIDDLLATGGTIGAMCGLLEKLDIEVVKNLFLIELTDLNGSKILKDNVISLVKY